MKSFLLMSAGVVYGITALLLLGAVLLQESKGGGLAALGGTRAEGAFGASNPLRRLTVVLSIIFFLLASALSLALAPPKSVTGEGEKPPAADGGEEGVEKDGDKKPPEGKKPGTSLTAPTKDGDEKPPLPPKDGKKPAPEAPKKDEAKPGEKAPASKPAGKPEKKPAAG